MNPRVALELPGFLKRSLAGGHPWVYRDHVPAGFQATTGELVEVRCGAWRGYGLWDEQSAIALRIVSETRPPDAEWVRRRVRQAWELRDLVRTSGTTAYRWIFGEGDRLPGITVDLYGAFAVVVTYSPAVEPLLGWLIAALAEVAPLEGICRRVSRSEGSSKLELAWGRLPPREIVIEENGMRLRSNLFEGQKTGLFLDHRDNRRFIRDLASDKEVLNLFAYTGGFSVQAALGGARHVTSVDVSAAALGAARDNFELNGFDPDAHEFVDQDVFEYLEHANSRARRFDLVICDPPSFARSQKQREAALHAYRRVNTLGLRVTRPGGLYAAASCTSQVSPKDFIDSLADAARQAKRRLQILHDAGQPCDHPVLAQHPEGRYLKFVLSRALPLD